jgi:hypothetical protein
MLRALGVDGLTKHPAAVAELRDKGLGDGSGA